MTKIDLQVSEDYISKATMVIAKLNSLHLLNVRKIPLGQNDLESNQENLFVNKYRQLNHRLKNLTKSLGLEFEIPCCPLIKDFDPYKDIIKLENELQEKENEINEILEKIKLERESKKERGQ